MFGFISGSGEASAMQAAIPGSAISLLGAFFSTYRRSKHGELTARRAASVIHKHEGVCRCSCHQFFVRPHVLRACFHGRARKHGTRHCESPLPSSRPASPTTLAKRWTPLFPPCLRVSDSLKPMPATVPSTVPPCNRVKTSSVLHKKSSLTHL